MENKKHHIKRLYFKLERKNEGFRGMKMKRFIIKSHVSIDFTGFVCYDHIIYLKKYGGGNYES